MGNVISSFLSPELCGPILSCVGGQAKYIWGLKRNLGALETESDKLIQTRDDLLDQVELAEQQPRTRRTNQVKGWLQRVEKMETKVADLQQIRDQEIDRFCLRGICSKDLISTYDFGKRVLKLRQEVIDIKNERGDINYVSEMIPEDPAVELPVEQTVVVKNQYLTEFGDVSQTKKRKWELLACMHHFDVVIWAVLSQEPKPEKLQDDIAKRLGLSDESWKQKSPQDKALNISNILSQKKFVLLLDDRWQPIDLTELGVPLQSLNIGSKIIFTTRSHEVCGQMKADKLELSCLRDDEAWKLFREEVGRDVLENHPSIHELAKTIARECCGLPLALKTVGRAMRSINNIEEWTRAINILRTSASRFSGMEEVFSRLKFSYDSLPRDELRSCLQYCCLFPEDFEIHKTVVIDYWISEGFLNDVGDGYTVIGDLLRACLLEEEGNYVKMHDMIPEMALWIACTIQKKFLVYTGVQLTKTPPIEEWERVERISMMANKIKNILETPSCPRLETLLLNENEIEMISDGFFKFMPSLKVLSLRGNASLIKLSSEISSLILLQHVDLSWTNIHELPQELKALVNLRYLNLDFTSSLFRIPQRLISSFSKLQVLRMFKCGPLPKIDHKGNVLSRDAESLIKELHSLKQLNLLSLTLNTSRAVPNLLEFPNLVSITESQCFRKAEGSAPLNFLHLAHMEHLKVLQIESCEFEEFKIDSTGEVETVLQNGFRSLRRVSVIFSVEKDLTWLTFASNLKELELTFCLYMEEIISVEKLSKVLEIMGELNLFARLESLKLGVAYKLKSIHQNPLPFPQLKQISVNICRNLKKLPLNSSSLKVPQIVIMGEQEWWEKLQWEDIATKNAFSPCFVAREGEKA